MDATSFHLRLPETNTQPLGPGKIADLAAAYGQLYAPDTEPIEMLWNNSALTFDYPHDFPELLTNMVPALTELYFADSGERFIELRGTRYHGALWLRWENEVVTLEGLWKRTGHEELFDDGFTPPEKTVKLSKEAFLGEWKYPLVQFLKVLPRDHTRFLSLDAQDIILQAQDLVKWIPQGGRFHPNTRSGLDPRVIAAAVGILGAGGGLAWYLTSG